MFNFYETAKQPVAVCFSAECVVCTQATYFHVRQSIIDLSGYLASRDCVASLLFYSIMIRITVIEVAIAHTM